MGIIDFQDVYFDQVKEKKWMDKWWRCFKAWVHVNSGISSLPYPILYLYFSFPKITLTFTNPNINTKYFGIATPLPTTNLLNEVDLFLYLDYNSTESVHFLK